MSPAVVIISSIVYLGILFLIAFRAQKNPRKSTSIQSAWIYALSMGVYCTAWTYYGSVGKASRDGIDFLAVYIGPTLMAPVWWIVLRKIIRIAQVQRITTIADFISSRYGKNISLGSIVTVFCFIGIIPYIALQLKAISESFEIITSQSTAQTFSGSILKDTSFYVVIIMAIFTLLFGTRKIETTERHQGMMSAIAFESIVKLVAFLVIGFFLVYYAFDGFGDLFNQALANENTSKLLLMPEKSGYREWFWITILSALAFTLLPRQFQVNVVENTNENHIKTATWVFPTYLLLINLFVLPVAIGGIILSKGEAYNADYFLLHIPMMFDQNLLALFIFIGGISAATSMIVVETMALSTMFSNNLLIPFIVGNDRLKMKYGKHLSAITIWSRRLSIVFILLLAYWYYHRLDQYYSLVSIGLISFISVAQFAPALIGGIFWKKGTRKGAIAGILIGFAIWFYTLVIPSLLGNSAFGQDLLENGLFGWSALRPQALFGLEGFSPISHAMFWSMFWNIIAYITVSFNSTQNNVERNQSEVFVDIFKYSAIYENTIVLKGKASVPDVIKTLSQFFGEDRSAQVIRLFAKKYDIDISDPTNIADPRIIAYAERLLGGVIGSASARMMMSSAVVEDDVRIDEVVSIVRESQQLLIANRELTRKSVELKNALDELEVVNIKLQENDQIKDDFLSTVTHELRTPITSIRALNEILFDNPDLETEDRQHYLGIVIKETERLSRLISQVLDLERYESGRQKLTLNRCTAFELIHDSVEAVNQLIVEQKITLDIIDNTNDIELIADKDKMIQVFLNLLSNALKFVESGDGKITVRAEVVASFMMFEIIDNGKGIEEEFQKMIFEKFFQAKNQLMRKPKGTGLGLAICKKILDLHKGKIEVESQPGIGSTFRFYVPLYLDQKIKEDNNSIE
ncbi:MAG: sensor histidine kinase [Flavobacteriales bacterium]